MKVCAVILLAALALPAVRLGPVHQFGGSDAETVVAMARDSSGNLFVTGQTNSYDFPANVLQTHPGGSTLWRASSSGVTALYGHRAAQVFSVAIDRAHPGVVLAWTSRGLLRSTDFGDTWSGVATGLPAPNGGRLAIDPRDGRSVYLATSATGIFKSTDGGATWVASNTGISANRAGLYPDQIALDPANPSVLLTTDAFDQGTMYRSTDGAATWQVQSFAVQSVVFDPRHAGTAWGLSGGTVFRSLDDGVTWSAVVTPAQKAQYLTVDAGGSVYYASYGYGYGVTVTTDGGASWINHPIYANVNGLGADPDTGTVYAATDTGVLASSDRFATTSRIAISLAVSGLAVTAAQGTLFVASAQASSDAYVMKIDASGNLIWATYLGGSRGEFATGLAVDIAGNVYVLGQTGSADFPVSSGAMASGQGFGNFLVKISGSGALIYSATFMDGGAAAGLAVDASGSAFVAGTGTNYIGGSIFSVAVPYPIACKVDGAATQMLYCTKMDRGRAYAIATAPDGSAYLGGDGAIWKLNPSGSVVWQKTIAGSTMQVLKVDSNGLLYAAGSTTSATFPATPGAFQQQFNGYKQLIAGLMVAYSNDHGFVLRMADTGDILNATLLEGENWDHVLALTLDGTGDVTVGGVTASNSFPLAGAFQMRFAYYTGFVARLSGDLSTLLFSTYVGDARNFQVSGVAVEDDGSVRFAGDTSNLSSYFGGTSTLATSSDAFVAELDPVAPAPPQIRGVLNTASQVGTRIAPNQSITVAADGAGQDAEVLIDDDAVPVLSSAQGQIVASIPVDRSVTAASQVRVRSGGQVSDALLVAGATSAPAIYTRDLSGHGEALVWHEDGTLNGPDNPASPGSVIAIACTGVGHLTFDGDYAVTDVPVSVYVDGFYASGVDAHMVQIPGIPGDTYVIRVKVPDPGFKIPPVVSLTLNIGGRSNVSGILSQADVGISIQQ